MKVIHLSDIHLGPPGMTSCGLDPYDRLARAFGHIAEHHRDAALVVISGDLTEYAEREAYARLKQALTMLPMPVRLMVGNHDDRDVFFKVFRDHPRDTEGYVNHSADFREGRFIFCDTVEKGRDDGYFGPDRLRWLTGQLEGCDRAFLFFHHNPLHTGDPSADADSLRDADQGPLRDLLKANAAKVAHLFFGHVHASLCGTMGGIAFSGVPSTMMQRIPNLSPAARTAIGPLDPSYRVVLIRGDDVVIHQIPFAYDGELDWFANA